MTSHTGHLEGMSGTLYHSQAHCGFHAHDPCPVELTILSGPLPFPAQSQLSGAASPQSHPDIISGWGSSWVCTYFK